ncbi:MAG: hypothetical protein ACJ79K_06960 [Gemmatimonadaceae bacterium]
MPDEKDSAPRARPFTPPLPPYRGPAPAARAPINPLTPPESKRGALFVGTRTPSKPAIPEQAPVDIAALAPDRVPNAALAATEAMPWLFADPQSAETPPAHPDPLPGILGSHVPSGDDAAPEEAAQALSGLPYIDQTGEAHQAEAVHATPRLSGKMHRIDFDVAGILEGIAARVRAGDIDVGHVDAGAGEAAALASVLAALLHQRPR